MPKVTETPNVTQDWRVEQPVQVAIDEGAAEPGDLWIVGGPFDEVVVTVHGGKVMAADALAHLIVTELQGRDS